MSEHPEDEAVVETTIEHTLSELGYTLPPEAQEELRTVLRLILSTHPDAVSALRALRTRPALNRSDDLVVDPDAVAEVRKSSRER